MMQDLPTNLGVLLTATYELHIYGFDIATCQDVADFEISNSQANRIVTVPNEPKFYVGAYSYIFGYDFCPSNRKQTQALLGHEGNVTDLVVTPTTLLSCGEDKKINIWDRRNTQKPQGTIVTTSSLNSIILAPNGESCVVCDENGVVSMWDLRQTSTFLKKTPATKIPVRSLAVAPNGTAFIAAAQDGQTVNYKFDGDSFTENYRIQAHNETQVRCAVSPNSKLFATAAADNSARIWDLESGDMKQQLLCSGEGQEWIWDVAFTNDSKFICTGGSDCVARVWDVENGRMVSQMPGLERCISAIAIIDSQ